jgi:hypothetical protein
MHIHRADEKWKDRLRAYKVVVDGRVVGKIKRGETKSFELEPGQHEVYAKIDWTQSQTLRIDVGAGDKVDLTVSNNTTFIPGANDSRPWLIAAISTQIDSYLSLVPSDTTPPDS